MSEDEARSRGYVVFGDLIKHFIWWPVRFTTGGFCWLRTAYARSVRTPFGDEHFFVGALYYTEAAAVESKLKGKT